jgi:hypothetical protein
MGYELKRLDGSEGLRGALGADPYFDVTVEGMNFLRNMMRLFDMLVDVAPPQPRESHVFDVTSPVDRTDPENDLKIDAFLQANADRVSADSGVDGIPSYKLESNDEWMVTPREISLSLSRYFSVQAGALSDPLWETFIAFLCVAMACGGFVAR